MIRHSLVGLALVASVVSAAPAGAQVAAAPAVSDSGFTATPVVMRVSLFRWADGMQQAGVADMQTHLIPIWEAQKAAGLILAYSTMNNPNPNSKDDWQFGTTVTFANNAALDGLGAKIAAITLKHYGTAAARTAAGDARAKLRMLISSNQINVATYTRK